MMQLLTMTKRQLGGQAVGNKRENKDNRNHDLLNAKINIRMDQQAESLFKSETVRRKRLARGPKLIVALSISLVVLLFLSLTVLPVYHFGPLSTATDWRYHIIYSFDYLAKVLMGDASWYFYTQIIIPVIGGACLGTAGAVCQGVFRNPMASPTTVGATAGGVLAGTLYFFYGYKSYAEIHGVISFKLSDAANWLDSMNFLQRYAYDGTLIIIGGCLVGMLAVVGISSAVGKGKISTVTLLLSGLILALAANEFGMTLYYVLSAGKVDGDDEFRAAKIQGLLGGNFGTNNLGITHMLMFLVPAIVCCIAIYIFANNLNVIAFGHDEAKAMGVNVTATRNVLIIAGAILLGVTLANCGQLNMLGLVIPYFARYLVGPDFKALLPVSTVLGALITLIIWDLCNMYWTAAPFNMVMGVVCGGLSLVLIIKNRRNRHADWA